MRGLQNKVAIVTGGGGRIGSATATRLAEEGARVVVADLIAEAGERTAKAIGANAIAIPFDGNDPDSVANLIHATVEHWGRLDILHNNAALTDLKFLDRDQDVVSTPMEVWDQTMIGNARSYFLTAKHAVPEMLKVGGGAIINTASGAALVAENARISYGSSKGAVVTLTKYIATHHGRQGIRCNAISPGLIVNDALAAEISEFLAVSNRQLITPRPGKPDDIAALVAFLASEDAEFINGQNICCDGGILAHSPAMADVLDMAESEWGK
ncbi:MAG: short-chain dehydrogenase [Porticoccaceae bacterium]|nr:short-chain dehydrogenase [Porticoccaceae bacterium]